MRIVFKRGEYTFLKQFFTPLRRPAKVKLLSHGKEVAEVAEFGLITHEHQYKTYWS
jgi:hypothetical protein